MTFRPATYRTFSTHIFIEKDEAPFEALSIGDMTVQVGVCPLRDAIAIKRMARYWRSRLELPARAVEDYDAKFQTFIHARGHKIPVDHFCAEVNGRVVWLEFTASKIYLSVDGRQQQVTTNRYRALRLFASALTRLALEK